MTTACTTKQQTTGIDLANLDTTAVAQNDFYQFACGGWMAKNPLDAEHSRYGAFDVLAENALKNVNDIIDSVSKNKNEAGSLADKIATLYNIGMDSAKLQADGVAPLTPYLEEINNVKTTNDAWQEMLRMHKRGNTVLFGVFGEADKDDATMCIAWAYQGGLGLGDRDYYLLDEGNNKKIREGYVELMNKLFAMSGYDQLSGKKADKLAQTVMSFETRLAKAMNTKLENRNPQATFNRYTVDSAASVYGNIDWKGYFEAMNIMEGMKSFNIAQPKYFEEVNKVLADADIETLKAYFAWYTITSADESLRGRSSACRRSRILHSRSRRSGSWRHW